MILSLYKKLKWADKKILKPLKFKLIIFHCTLLSNNCNLILVLIFRNSIYRQSIL